MYKKKKKNKLRSLLPSYLSSILRWGAGKLPEAQRGYIGAAVSHWAVKNHTGVGQTDGVATSHLPAGSNTTQLTDNKLPRPLEILKEHSAA